ncbi:MAG: hypothetical protein ACKOJB_01665 [Chthoniobacterales bacterium]
MKTRSLVLLALLFTSAALLAQEQVAVVRYLDKSGEPQKDG